MNSILKLPNGRETILFCISLLMTLGSACQRETGGLLEVEVRGVGVDPETNSPVMFLQDKTSSRGIPVWIGSNEASAIRMELEHIATARPLTHDLMKSILEQLDAKIERIVIEDLKDTTYYASLFIKVGNKRITIDGRPSDAVALALKCKAPLFVSNVLVKKGILIDLEANESQREVEQRFGIYFQDITASVARYFELPDAKGVIVTDIEAGGASEAAGLRKGDAILKVDGNRVAGSEDFQRILSRHKPSEATRFEIFRKGGTFTYTLRAKERVKESEEGE